MLINDIVKRNLGGKTEVLAVLRSENERIKALKDWFDIDLTESERAAISGHGTEIIPTT